jgi:signal transduction histidine kinase
MCAIRPRDGRVTVAVGVAEGLPPLIGDAWAARRIVENLLDNAVKFTPLGGSVNIVAMPSDQAVAVTVTDTGEGMPADVLAIISRPFYEADQGAHDKFEGMGAGLALSRRLADAIGAELSFRSMPGMGTSATVLFPCHRSAQPAGRAEAGAARAGARQLIDAA